MIYEFYDLSLDLDFSHKTITFCGTNIIEPSYNKKTDSMEPFREVTKLCVHYQLQPLTDTKQQFSSSIGSCGTIIHYRYT